MKLKTYIKTQFERKFPGAKVAVRYDGEDETWRATVRVAGEAATTWQMAIGTDDDVLSFKARGKRVVFPLPAEMQP